MAVKHNPTGVVHQGNRGGTTGCGVDTNIKGVRVNLNILY